MLLRYCRYVVDGQVKKKDIAIGPEAHVVNGFGIHTKPQSSACVAQIDQKRFTVPVGVLIVCVGIVYFT